MQVDKLYLEQELIPVGFDARDLDVFVDRKLVEAHYKNRGYIVIPGFDFENNMVFALKDEFAYLDPYLQVKLGRAKGSPLVGAYANQVLQHVNKQEIMPLLYLCRLCSYLGGPGFPEFIIIDKSGSWSLVIVVEEPPAEYALFAFMIRLLGLCEIKMAKIKRKEASEKTAIDMKAILENIAATERFRNFVENIESELHKLNSDKSDELKFLEEQMCKTPFFLIKKWLKEGAVKSDILYAYENFEASNSGMKALIARISAEIRDNSEYVAISNNKDEETLKKKFDWLMKTFSIGESRAKEVLPMLI